MSRNKFFTIKEKIKMSKDNDANPNDRAWRVRKLLEIFRENVKDLVIFQQLCPLTK